jgi:phage I-like protein
MADWKSYEITRLRSALQKILTVRPAGDCKNETIIKMERIALFALENRLEPVTKQKTTYKETLEQLRQRPGETDKNHKRRLSAFFRGDDARVKTDLKGFKTCDFTFAPEKP